jgi:hypothetical protein
MHIDLRKNPNIQRNPKNHEDALARRAEILALLEEQDYVNPKKHPKYIKATEQVHELLAVKLDLEAQKDERNQPLQELTAEETRAAKIHRRALIDEAAARAPKERPPASTAVAAENSGTPVIVNERDELLIPADLADHVLA